MAADRHCFSKQQIVEKGCFKTALQTWLVLPIMTPQFYDSCATNLRHFTVINGFKPILIQTPFQVSKATTLETS
jgi:hypothetical protein